MSKLTSREIEILTLLRQSIDSGIVPSVRELCTKLNIKSTSTVHRCLTSLQEKGYIQRETHLNRAIRLPDQPVSRVPLVGLVTAGAPILAVESIEDYIPVAMRNDAKDLFALRVRGESMINAGILDGDIIIARQTPVASNGEIVVAMVGDEATVKRFYKEHGGYRLQPENDEMEPIFVKQVSILGKVVALHRSY